LQQCKSGVAAAQATRDDLLEPEEVGEAVDAVSVRRSSTFYTGTAPQNPLEVKGELPPNYMLTGIGARIAPGNNVTTLRLRGQRINTDGSLGTEADFNFGQGSALEAFYEVPAGYGIVGIEMRENNDNLTTLVVHYRQYSAAQRKFTGRTSTQRVGTAPNSATEVKFGTWDMGVSDEDKYAIVGVGLRAHGGAITTMAVTVGLIAP
jgi:hypothetical protein